MLEAVLIDLLMRKNILTQVEAKSLIDVHSLYNKLVQEGEFEPLSEADQNVLRQLEKLKKSRISMGDKLVKLRRLESLAESDVLQALIRKIILKIKEIRKD